MRKLFDSKQIREEAVDTIDYWIIQGYHVDDVIEIIRHMHHLLKKEHKDKVDMLLNV